MAIPTIVLGAPAALTPASIAGLNAFANPTTATKETNNRAELTSVLILLGLGACTLLSVFCALDLGR